MRKCPRLPMSSTIFLWVFSARAPLTVRVKKRSLFSACATQDAPRAAAAGDGADERDAHPRQGAHAEALREVPQLAFRRLRPQFASRVDDVAPGDA
eukprot:1267862-Pleurochrysis_carterae.AAC.3